MKKTKPEFNWDLVAGYTEDKTKKATGATSDTSRFPSPGLK